jgi:hypothetical protein
MKNIKFTTDGKRFDLNAAEKLGGVSNIQKDDTRGKSLYKSASGNYLLLSWSRWQGESDKWEVVSREEARDLALKHWTTEEVLAEFPEADNLEDEV